MLSEFMQMTVVTSLLVAKEQYHRDLGIILMLFSSDGIYITSISKGISQGLPLMLLPLLTRRGVHVMHRLLVLLLLVLLAVRVVLGDVRWCCW